LSKADYYNLGTTGFYNFNRCILYNSSFFIPVHGFVNTIKTCIVYIFCY